MKTAEQRFLEKITKTDTCWLWNEWLNKKGYGYGFIDNGKTKLAHRVSYELFKGKIPDGMCICHSCDVRNCVNPDHLWIGTNADNVKDRDAKGRRAVRGEKNGFHKLTEQQILDIRSRPLPYGEMAKIAKDFKVTQAAISLIVKRINWSHI